MKDEHASLGSLKKEHSLTIKPFDKGGNIVIMTNEQYATMCQKVINNKSWYRPISKSVIDKFNDAFYDLID